MHGFCAIPVSECRRQLTGIKSAVLARIIIIITKSCEFETQSSAPAPKGIAEEGFGGKLTSADFREVLEADTDDATYDELKSWICAINHDVQCQFVALVWIGRGDFGKEEWDEALKIAHDEHNNWTAGNLLGMLLPPDNLEDGLSQFEHSYAV